MPPAKPPFRSPCNHCGACCKAELCGAAELVYGTRVDPPCPSLVATHDGYLCALVLAEIHTGQPPLVQIALGIGFGCGMSDSETTEEDLDSWNRLCLTLARRKTERLPPKSTPPGENSVAKGKEFG